MFKRTFSVTLCCSLSYLIVATTLQSQIANGQSQNLDHRESATAADMWRSHVVQPGETLSQIAQQYGLTDETLIDANELRNVDFLFVGQELRIPDSPDLTTLTTEERVSTEQLEAFPIHVIGSGETLSEIAEQYDLKQAELLDLNGISDADQIYVGQRLRIPRPAAEAPSEERSLPPLSSAVEVTTSVMISTTGGVQGPESVQGPLIINEPMLPSIAYTVKRGETLSEIAVHFDVPISEIMSLNQIVDPDAIFAGMALEMPPIRPTSSQQKSDGDNTFTSPVASPSELGTYQSNTDASPDADSRGDDVLIIERQYADQGFVMSLNSRYLVQNGDSISRIALREGVDREALIEINQLGVAGNGTLSVGDMLVLPATRQDTLALALDALTENALDDSTYYVVESGDNLSTIALENGLTTLELMVANGLTNPDSVLAGQRLYIPPPSTPEERVAHLMTDQRLAMFRGYYYYTVRAGDTLSEIAEEFDTTIIALIEYNGLPDEETVYQGLELRIPYGPPPVPVDFPPSPGSGSRFVVSLSRQECWLIRGDYVTKAWKCSTGYGEWTTRTGTFNIKTRMEMAKSSAYELDMPYWLGLYDVGSFENGIHGLPIRWSNGEKLWSNLIGQPATFGCAMLDDPDAEFLFEASYLGMPVHIVE